MKVTRLYINALVKSIKNKIEKINWKPELIIASYHGIPQSYFDKGDPYQCYCQKTTRLIKEKFTNIEITNYISNQDLDHREWLKALYRQNPR